MPTHETIKSNKNSSGVSASPKKKIDSKGTSKPKATNVIKSLKTIKKTKRKVKKKISYTLNAKTIDDFFYNLHPMRKFVHLNYIELMTGSKISTTNPRQIRNITRKTNVPGKGNAITKNRKKMAALNTRRVLLTDEWVLVADYINNAPVPSRLDLKYTSIPSRVLDILMYRNEVQAIRAFLMMGYSAAEIAKAIKVINTRRIVTASDITIFSYFFWNLNSEYDDVTYYPIRLLPLYIKKVRESSYIDPDNRGDDDSEVRINGMFDPISGMNVPWKLLYSRNSDIPLKSFDLVCDIGQGNDMSKDSVLRQLNLDSLIDKNLPDIFRGLINKGLRHAYESADLPSHSRNQFAAAVVTLDKLVNIMDVLNIKVTEDDKMSQREVIVHDSPEDYGLEGTVIER